MGYRKSYLLLRKYRKDNKLCTKCGVPVPEGTLCEQHKQVNKEANRKANIKRVEQGHCRIWGCNNKPEGGNKTCDECIKKQKEENKGRRDFRKYSGVCTQCGERPADKTRVRCGECHRKMMKSIRALQADRLRRGLCRRCGERPKVPEKRRPLCAECYADGRTRQQRLKEEVIAAYGGPICVGCGEADIRILQIDHIHGGGNQHLLEIGGGALYGWLQRNGFPLGYRVLCPSCNIRAARKIPFPNEVKKDTVPEPV